MSGLQLPQLTVPFQKHLKLNTVYRLLVGKSTKKPPYNLCYCPKGEVLCVFKAPPHYTCGELPGLDLDTVCPAAAWLPCWAFQSRTFPEVYKKLNGKLAFTVHNKGSLERVFSLFSSSARLR